MPGSGHNPRTTRGSPSHTASATLRCGTLAGSLGRSTPRNACGSMPMSAPRVAGSLLLLGVACRTATTPADEAPRFPVVNPAAVTPTTLPTGGPWYHTVRTASSRDGLTFQDDRVPDVVEHAS